MVTEMKYPSPLGFVTVTAQEVNDYWADVKLEEILDPVAGREVEQCLGIWMLPDLLDFYM